MDRYVVVPVPYDTVQFHQLEIIIPIAGLFFRNQPKGDVHIIFQIYYPYVRYVNTFAHKYNVSE